MLLRLVDSWPTSEPVTLEQVKLSGRIDGTEFDTMIPLHIASARSVAEHQSGRILAARTITAELDGWPDSSIAITPASSVVVTYFDGSAWQTLPTTVYAFVPESSGFALSLKSGQSWPTLPDVSGPRVKVAVTVDAETVPTAQHYIIAQVVYWLDNPGAASERRSEPSPFLAHLLDAIKVY